MTQMPINKVSLWFVLGWFVSQVRTLYRAPAFARSENEDCRAEAHGAKAGRNQRAEMRFELRPGKPVLSGRLLISAKRELRITCEMSGEAYV